LAYWLETRSSLELYSIVGPRDDIKGIAFCLKLAIYVEHIRAPCDAGHPLLTIGYSRPITEIHSGSLYIIYYGSY